MFTCVRTEFLIILQVDAEGVRAQQDKTFIRMLLTKATCGIGGQYKSQFKRLDKSPATSPTQDGTISQYKMEQSTLPAQRIQPEEQNTTKREEERAPDAFKYTKITCMKVMCMLLKTINW